jgi:ABC-type lipoprotein release transport system permease subunit
VIFLQLAARNVLRNTRRSAITVTAIAIGMATLLFTWAFIDGVNDQMIENSTRYLTGHLPVHKRGYHDDQVLDQSLPDARAAVARVRELPGVAAVTRRLQASALASLEDKSRGVVVLGVDPAAEREVTTLAQTIEQGAFLQAADAEGIVLGARIVEALRATVGSEIVLVGQGVDGSIAAGRFKVRGIFRTRMDMLDGVYVLLPMAAAQELYATGETATTVVARLGRRGGVDTAVQRLRDGLGRQYEVLPWQTLLPSVVQSVAFHDVTGYVLLLVLFLVVAVGIMNTVLMAVMERTREFGVMMALGTGRGQLMRLVFYEASLLGIAGLALGTVAGLAITGYYASTGMDFGRYVRAMETMQGLTAMVYPLPRVDRALVEAALVFATAVCAALYPAWRAARLAPVEAIRGTVPAGRVIHWLRRGRDPDSRPAAFPLPLPLPMRIAARSIGRNPQRTALTMAATAFGLAGFIFFIGMVDGYLRQLVDNSTGYVTGHLQVQHPRFRTEMEPAHSLGDAGRLLQMLRRHPQVAAAAPRVQSMALANSTGQSQNFMLIGVDPAAEAEVTAIHRTVRQGRPLAAGAEREIVLGDRLADKLGLRLGEKLVVMAQSADGAVGSAAYRLAGTFDTGSDAFDGLLGYVTLPAAQALLGMGANVSTVAVRLRDLERVGDVQAALQESLDPGLAVALGWRTLLPEVDQMTEYVRAILRLLTGIVLGMAAIGVMNTLLMSVMERTRELGIMMALGTRPRAVVALVVLEALVLGTGGVAAGFALGWPLVRYLGSAGLDLSRYAQGVESIPGMTGIIYPDVVPANLLLPSLALLGLNMLAALYPGWRAAQLDPARAIRHV